MWRFADFVHVEFTNRQRPRRKDRSHKEKKIRGNLSPMTLRKAPARVGRGRSWTGRFSDSLVPVYEFRRGAGSVPERPFTGSRMGQAGRHRTKTGRAFGRAIVISD